MFFVHVFIIQTFCFSCKLYIFIAFFSIKTAFILIPDALYSFSFLHSFSFLYLNFIPVLISFQYLFLRLY